MGRAPWLELTDFPESYMLLMDTGPDGLPDPATEVRLPLHRGARSCSTRNGSGTSSVHNGNAPRYALISSFESGPALDAWVQSQPRTGTSYASAVSSAALKRAGASTIG